MYRGTPKYRPDFHPNDLVERMARGELNTQVFAAWEISSKTFYKWLQEHEELKEAYDAGLVKCEAEWIRKGVERFDQKIDKGFKYYDLIMNSKFNYKNQANITNNNTINVQGDLNVLKGRSTAELEELLQDKLAKLSQYTEIPTLKVVDAEVVDVKPTAPKE